MAVEATSEAEKEPEPPETLKPTIKRRREHTLVTFADDNLNLNSFNDNSPEDAFRHEGIESRNVKRASCSSSSSNQQRKRTISESSYFSGASSIMSSSSSISSPQGGVAYTYHAPDGGYGWVVVIASFLVNMIADGVTFSFGVLFDELQKEFGESKAVTAGVVSVFHAVPLLSGPVASALTDRYGCRKVTIVGAILASIGFLLSAVTPHLELLYVTFGLISGFGLSLCYVAAVVIVAYYFDAKRSFATGISVCGSGVGTFLFAPLTQYLVDEYNGWRGATVILAGIFLNMVICGALFRDLEWTKTFRKKSKHKIKGSLEGGQNIKGGSSSTLSSPSRSSMPEVDELRTILESGDITALFSSEELSELSQARLSSSLVNLPTFLHCNEPLPDEVINAFSRNEAAHSLILRHFPNSIIAKNLRGCSDENDPEAEPEKADDNPEEVIKDHQAEKSMIKLKRKVSSLFKTKPRPILKKPQNRTSSIEIEDSENNATKIDMDNAEVTENLIPKQNLHHLRVRKQSLTYRGAMLSIPRYRLRASSCPDIYRNSITTIAFNADFEDENCCQRSSNGLLNCFKEWKEFINPAYLVFALSNFILYAWYDVMYVYLYNYAEMDLKFTSSKATFLLSIIGILNTLGEVIIGWLGDQSWMNLNILYAFCMIICGGSTALVPFLTDYYALSGMAGLYGLCISANYALSSPILVNLVSLEQFSNAYGLLLLVQGISNLIGPPFAGFLYDTYKIWHYTFGLGGLFIVLSGLLLLILPCFRQAKLLQNEYNKRRASSVSIPCSNGTSPRPVSV